MTAETAQRFFFIGGELCLDFANTATRRGGEPPWRSLQGYDSLVRWGEASGALTHAEADRLLREGGRRAGKAEAALEEASRLQDLIYRIFSAGIDGQPPRARDIEALNAALSDALPYRRIAPADGAFQWTWVKPKERLDCVLWPILRSAADLLTSDRLSRVKKCHGCGWLFLDSSKNGARRWCMMSVCGNRSKARRYYQRNHKGKRRNAPLRIA